MISDCTQRRWHDDCTTEKSVKEESMYFNGICRCRRVVLFRTQTSSFFFQLLLFLFLNWCRWSVKWNREKCGFLLAKVASLVVDFPRLESKINCVRTCWLLRQRCLLCHYEQCKLFFFLRILLFRLGLIFKKFLYLCIHIQFKLFASVQCLFLSAFSLTWFLLELYL